MKILVMKILVASALLAAAPASAESWTIVDEEIGIRAREAEVRGFSIPGDLTGAKLTVFAIGRKHADKGFTVHLLLGKGEWEKYRTKKPFNEVQTFRGLKVTRFDQSAELPPGDYALVVANTENLIKSMVVAIRVTVEPRRKQPGG